SRVSTPVTLVCSKILTPAVRAPLASAKAMLAGSALPSFGRNTPPFTSSQFSRGIGLSNLGRRQELHLQSEGLGHRGSALEFLQALVRQGHAQRAALAKAGFLARLGAQIYVEFSRILCEPSQVESGSELPDQTGRVPGGTARQLLSLQQNDIGPAELGEVIGHR